MHYANYAELTDDAKEAIATARATGSVGATVNGTQVQRLYTHQGGIGGGSMPTGLWLVTRRNGQKFVTEAVS